LTPAIIIDAYDPPKDQTIRIDTRTGTAIPNVQDPVLPPDKLDVAAAVRDKYVRGSTLLLNGPSGFYNCAGLVFASRRSQIIEMSLIWSILEQDAYRKVENEREVAIGDVAVYSQDTRCEHVGLVVASPELPLGVPRILSKFGWAIEAVHFAHEGPYADFSRQYFRIRNYDT
jgi:hypothetical protein